MEVARVELCESLGMRYGDMEKTGVLLAVIGTQCRYISPVRFDDEVVIATSMSEATSRMVSFSYEMSVDGHRVASGETRHIFLNRAMKPARLPEQYWPIFGL
jgi:acyl-CoA thioester hydrolase